MSTVEALSREAKKNTFYKVRRRVLSPIRLKTGVLLRERGGGHEFTSFERWNFFQYKTKHDGQFTQQPVFH